MFIVRISKVLLLCALLALLAFEAYTIIVFYVEGQADLPPTFGNFQRVRDLLADDKPREQFSFAVVGDTKGHGTFEVIRENLSSEPLSFMVLLGDSVRAGTPGYHSYLRAEWAEGSPVPFPVFYVVGNHDVDPQRFPISEFEKNYGPTNFSFEYQECLFVVLRVIGQAQLMDESCRFLESQLSNRDKYRKIFVFMHKPPLVLPESLGEDMYNAQEVLSLFDRYRVDYVIAGDYHGYARVKRKNTVYLVSGGGGAHLKEVKYGAFHHAVVVTVGPDSVSERILFADRSEDIEDALERYALGELYPWLKDNYVLAIILNGAILTLCFWLLRSLIKSNRSLRPN